MPTITTPDVSTDKVCPPTVVSAPTDSVEDPMTTEPLPTALIVTDVPPIGTVVCPRLGDAPDAGLMEATVVSGEPLCPGCETATVVAAGSLLWGCEKPIVVAPAALLVGSDWLGSPAVEDGDDTPGSPGVEDGGDTTVDPAPAPDEAGWLSADEEELGGKGNKLDRLDGTTEDVGDGPALDEPPPGEAEELDSGTAVGPGTVAVGDAV